MGPTYAQLRLDLASALAQFLDPEEAHAESLLWFEEGLGRSRSWLAAHGREPIPDGERRQLGAWMRRRKAGEPWAYLVGWSSWRGRRFEVGPAVLIPRPETELLLEAALAVGRRLGVRRAVDVGTGSGILAVTLALETSWEIAGTDLSSGALEVAGRNAATLGADVTFLEGDLLGPVPDPLELVVSNPPYVDPADGPTLQPELAWEPASALFAPERGLAIATILIRQAWERGAWACLLEIGAGQGAELAARARSTGWGSVWVQPDFAGHDRVLILER